MHTRISYILFITLSPLPLQPDFVNTIVHMSILYHVEVQKTYLYFLEERHTSDSFALGKPLASFPEMEFPDAGSVFNASC